MIPPLHVIGVVAFKIIVWAAVTYFFVAPAIDLANDPGEDSDTVGYAFLLAFVASVLLGVALWL